MLRLKFSPLESLSYLLEGEGRYLGFLLSMYNQNKMDVNNDRQNPDERERNSIVVQIPLEEQNMENLHVQQPLITSDSTTVTRELEVRLSPIVNTAGTREVSRLLGDACTLGLHESVHDLLGSSKRTRVKSLRGLRMEFKKLVTTIGQCY